jgi:hypothetical protein
MAYATRTIHDRIAVDDDVFILTELGDGRVRLTPDPTSVEEPGTPIDAALLQPIENAASVAVPQTRTITVQGPGITGGGNLSNNITIASVTLPSIYGTGTGDYAAIPYNLEGSISNGTGIFVSTRIVPFISGWLHIRFRASLIGSDGISGTVQIYRNDSPVGELHLLDDTEEEYYFIEEDIDGWQFGDRLSIRGTVVGGEIAVSDLMATARISP